MTRWLRRTVRRFGLDLPFRRVVCPEEIKTIAIDLQWRATVTVRRQMVFLAQPGEGDLRDIVPLDADADVLNLPESPDAIDIGRRALGAGTCIYWMPREPVVEYALYTHERSWMTDAQDIKDVLCTELLCRGRTGSMTIEIIAPVAYGSAVAFKLPAWHRLASERRLMQYALQQMQVSRSRPIISGAGTRVTWRVTRPRIGDRFVCIALTPPGLAAWQHELESGSVGSRLRRFLRLDPVRGAGGAGRVLLPGK
jgi:hypothetical protein